MSRYVLQNSGAPLETPEGRMTLGDAVVREAVQLVNQNSDDDRFLRFARSLARDGYVLTWEQEFPIRAALPEEVQLPQADDEVHNLLRQLNLSTALGHLNQAIDTHARGEWAACNSQLRTFLEGLLDEIAVRINPEAANLKTSENRRNDLALRGFLSENRVEWGNQGKNYVNGLFQMLHTHGSHPGLSDEEHSTFRLHVVLITARTFLRRFVSARQL